MSRTKAINDFCKECIYDKSEPGTWREQVELCNCTTCPLYGYRPRTGATINANRKPKWQGKGIELVVVPSAQEAVAA